MSTTDRLSTLPEPILHHILGFLDQKTVVKTCVLSKSWRYVWCTRPKFCYDTNYFRGKGHREASLSVLDRVLHFYHDRHLCLQDLTLNMWTANEPAAMLLNKWIPILSHMALQNFGIQFIQLKKFEMPPVFLESESLRNLSLQGCILSHHDPTEGVRVFNHLQKLFLREVYIPEEILDSVMSSCPFIERVTLSCCTGFASVKLLNSKPHQPTKLSFFHFGDYRHGAVRIEMGGDSIPTLRTVTIGSCLLALNHDNHLHFSHLTYLCMAYVKLSSEVFSCSLPCLEELNLIQCTGIKEFNMSSRSLKRLEIINPNRPFKAKIDAPSIVRFCYRDILPQSFSFAATTTTSDDWKSKIDLTRSDDPGHCFNDLYVLLKALSQSEVTLQLIRDEIPWLWNGFHNEDSPLDGSENINVCVSEAKLPVAVEHLVIADYWGQPQLSSADFLNNLFHMFRPSFIQMNLLRVFENEHHPVAELLLKEREMAQCYFWQHVLEEVNLQVSYEARSEWLPVEYTSFTEFRKKCALGKHRLQLKWRE